MKKLKIVNWIIILFISQYINAQSWAGIEQYETKNLQTELPAKGENRVVFFGNSITEEWGVFSPKFFKANPYINRGIGGQTSAQMLVRFRADVIYLKPTIVVILAGTNDIAENTGPSTNKMII